MSVGGIGTSASETSTVAPDNSFSAGDNAVQVRDQRKNVGNKSLKGKQISYTEGSTVINNNGAGSVEIADAVRQALDTAGDSGADIVSGPALQTKVTDAIQATTENAKKPDEEKKKIQKYALIAVAVIGVVGIAVVLSKKKGTS
jgi:hypothetical protein